MSSLLSVSPPPGRRVALATLLVVLCLLLCAPPVSAAEANETTVAAAPPVGMESQGAAISVLKHYNNFQGALPIGAVGGAGTGSSTPR